MRLRPFRTALVLGGGGARGLAHLGVLRVLREAEFRPDIIVGTSFGAIVGAAHALAPEQDLEQKFQDILSDDSLARIERKFGALVSDTADTGWRARVAGLLGSMRRVIAWNLQVTRQSLVDSVLVEELIDRLVARATFSDTVLPFYAVAFDLAHDTDVVIGEGDLALALRASCAIPGIFEPVATGGQLLVDGAVLQELPTKTARQLDADFVVAVDVGGGIDQRLPSSAADVLQRVLQLRGERFRAECRTLADVVIAPAVNDVHWSEFSRAAECLEAGAVATRTQLDAIQKRLRSARRRAFLRRLRSPSAIPVITNVGAQATIE